MYMKLENDSAVLEHNEKIARKAHQGHVFLTQKSKELWRKYGKKDTNGNSVMKSSKMSEVALKLQKKIDDAGAMELKYLLKGNVVWQGFV